MATSGRLLMKNAKSGFEKVIGVCTNPMRQGRVAVIGDGISFEDMWKVP